MGGILPQSPSLRILLALGGGILGLLILLLCALVVPGVVSPPTPTLAAVAQTPTASSTPTGRPTTVTIPTATSPPTSSATSAPAPTNTPTPAPCVPNSTFVADVTFPRGSTIAPGAPFIKTWRVNNSGGCAWDSSYSIVFVGGLALGPGSAPVPFASPGAVVDISLPMSAPAAPGSYSGIWRLKAPDGALFGANLNALITVLNPTTATPAITATAAPTRTFTPLPSISFYADSYSVQPGSCTILRWAAQNVQGIHLSGGEYAGTPGKPEKGPTGAEPACPSYPSTTYTLLVDLRDRTQQKPALTISVIDNTPPLNADVNPNPQEIGACSGPTTTTIQATVTDALGVTSVILYYYIGSPGSPLNSATMTTTDGKSFTTQLSANSLDYGTYSFYLVAFDRAGNQAQSGIYTFTVDTCIE